MSCTLSARIKPKHGWTWGFKHPLRDKLHNKFCNLIQSDAVPYLEGLRDACNDRGDTEALQEIIDALNDGDDIELDMQC